MIKFEFSFKEKKCIEISDIGIGFLKLRIFVEFACIMEVFVQNAGTMRVY